jgi:hypothetical protein
MGKSNSLKFRDDYVKKKSYENEFEDFVNYEIDEDKDTQAQQSSRLPKKKYEHSPRKYEKKMPKFANVKEFRKMYPEVYKKD